MFLSSRAFNCQQAISFIFWSVIQTRTQNLLINQTDVQGGGGKGCLPIPPPKKNILECRKTMPVNILNIMQEGLSEIFFEEYGFKSLLRTHPGDLTCYQNKLGNFICTYSSVL